MADTAVDIDTQTAAEERDGSWGPYDISPSEKAVIFIDATSDVAARKTGDGGATWAAKQVVVAGTVVRLSCFFDRELPGDGGNLIHCTWLDTAGGAGSEDWFYANYNISTGAWSSVVTIDGTLTLDGNNKQNFCWITKVEGGNLLAGFTTGSASDMQRSTDGGASWTSRVNPYESNARDTILGFPATVDPGDAALLLWDISANAISVKMYDDSANTVTETAILAGMVDPPVVGSYTNWDGAVMHSSGLIYAAAWNAHSAATADLVTFTVNPNSIAAPTVDTTTANVVSNQDESATCAVKINQQNDDVYIAYLKGGTLEATVDCVFHISTDDMVSFGVEQAYSEAAADDLRRVSSGRTVGNSGGHIQFLFWNDDLNDLFVNLVNDVPIAAVTGIVPIIAQQQMSLLRS